MFLKDFLNLYQWMTTVYTHHSCGTEKKNIQVIILTSSAYVTNMFIFMIYLLNVQKYNLILLFDFNVFILIAFLCKIYETIRLSNHVQFTFKYILYWTRLCLLLRFFIWVWGLSQIVYSCYDEETYSMTKNEIQGANMYKMCIYINYNIYIYIIYNL